VACICKKEGLTYTHREGRERISENKKQSGVSSYVAWFFSNCFCVAIVISQWACLPLLWGSSGLLAYLYRFLPMT
jgi:hypothetical protein